MSSPPGGGSGGAPSDLPILDSPAVPRKDAGVRAAAAATVRPSAGPTVFLAAARFEAAALLRRMDGASRHRDNGGAGSVRGRIRDRPVEVVVCGVGGRAARRAAERCVRLADRGACGQAIWIGIAGALSPDLGVGDLVVGRTAAAPNRVPVELDETLVAAAAAWGCRPAALITAARPVVAASSREALWRASGQRPVTAVDMESWEAARVLRSAGVPFAVLRAISDTAADRLPSWLESLPTVDGGFSPATAARRALARPSSIVPLMKVRLRAVRLAARLADAAASLA